METVRSETTARSAAPVSPFRPLLMSALTTKAPFSPARLIHSTACRAAPRSGPENPVPSTQSATAGAAASSASRPAKGRMGTPSVSARAR